MSPKDRIFPGMLTPSSNTMLEPVTARMLEGLPEVTAHFGLGAVEPRSDAPEYQRCICRLDQRKKGFADSGKARHDLVAWIRFNDSHPASRGHDVTCMEAATACAVAKHPRQ